MRLAFGMGRTVAELRETMDAHEWDRWLLFHSLYDLPDSFIVTGRLGELISSVVGGKGKPENFAPYYKIEPVAKPGQPARTEGKSDLKPFYGFLSAYAKERAASGNPLPSSTRKDGA